mgnify:CR=1 FL=1
MIDLKSSVRRRIQERLDQFVNDGASAGAQLALGFRDDSIGTFCSGIADPRNGIPVRSNTWFDLASLTKVICTATWTMRAMQLSMIDLDQPIRIYLPQLRSRLRERTIRMLLNHRSGLPPIFTNTQDVGSREEKRRFFVTQIDEAYQCEEEYPETVYSDVDFMLLGIILEQVFHQRLETFFHESDGLFYKPTFGRGKVRGLLARTFPMGWVAPILDLSEGAPWLQGLVQDPRARWFEGVSGHSGLFGTALGVERWARDLYMGFHGKSTFWSDKIVRRFLPLETMALSDNDRFVQGFDRPSGVSQAGTLLPRASTIGHLGYTGTSVWIDMESGMRISLLTHRFLPGIMPERLREVRPGIHDWLVGEVFSKLMWSYA